MKKVDSSFARANSNQVVYSPTSQQNRFEVHGFIKDDRNMGGRHEILDHY